MGQTAGQAPVGARTLGSKPGKQPGSRSSSRALVADPDRIAEIIGGRRCRCCCADLSQAPEHARERRPGFPTPTRPGNYGRPRWPPLSPKPSTPREPPVNAGPIDSTTTSCAPSATTTSAHEQRAPERVMRPTPREPAASGLESPLAASRSTVFSQSALSPNGTTLDEARSGTRGTRSVSALTADHRLERFPHDQQVQC